MTANTIIYSALRLLGLLRAGQTASTVETADIQIAAESKDAIRALNAAMGPAEPTMAPTNATPDGGK